MCPSPDDPQRRPPPRATGRQDRHTPPNRPDRAMPDEVRDDAYDEVSAGPRGQAFYDQGRAKSYGFGCLVAVAIGAIGAAALLVGLAFMPAGDEFGVAPGPVGGGGAADQAAPAPAPPAGD